MALFPSGLLVRRNLLILKLSAAGAGSPETAVTLEQAGVGNSRIFRKLADLMVRRGIIRRTDDGRLYSDK